MGRLWQLPLFHEGPESLAQPMQPPPNLPVPSVWHIAICYVFRSKQSSHKAAYAECLVPLRFKGATQGATQSKNQATTY